MKFYISYPSTDKKVKDLEFNNPFIESKYTHIKSNINLSSAILKSHETCEMLQIL